MCQATTLWVLYYTSLFSLTSLSISLPIPSVHQRKKRGFISTYLSEFVLLSSVLGRLHFGVLIFYFSIFSICMYLSIHSTSKKLHKSTLSRGGHPLQLILSHPKMVVHVTSALLCHIYSSICSCSKNSLEYF